MGRLTVAHSLEDVKALAPRAAAVTLGVFDGVHLGHREIIEELVRCRRRSRVRRCYLITFDPHPLVVTHSRTTPPMLTTPDERVELLGEFDLDAVVVLKFDAALANLDYRVFLERCLLRPFDMKTLVLGYDCRFGRNREGGSEAAARAGEKLGFDVRVVPARREEDGVVSSTRIRNALMNGDLSAANRLLGHPYLISGKVVKGHGRGHGLGFPTANLSLGDSHKLWPPRGVYAVQVKHGGRVYPGMMNVGRAPTVKSLPEGVREVEIHIFDFDGDLYGETLRVFCHSYLREEMRFPTVEALALQLEADKDRAREYLESHV